jgi:multidrug efflux pump subunit AcrA (membrane-fusion protein)
MQDIKTTLDVQFQECKLQAFETVYRTGRKSKIKQWMIGTFIVLIGILLLPWTQNIRTKGTVTTLRQEQRPQELNSIIAGRIVKWYVKEGDNVKQGDTIVKLAEIKDAYLDPELLNRTQEQINAKKEALLSYANKVSATESQIDALQNSLVLKLRQLSLKVVSDSMDAFAANNELKIAEEQYRRQRIMRDSGLASLVQVEQRNQAYQNAYAKKTSTEIKYTNTRTELNQVTQEYAEKMYKAKGEMAAARSEIATGSAEIAKLNNQYANYAIRNGMYFLLAPQSGQVTQATKAGLNEIIKEGEKIVEIIPIQTDKAVELFVRPIDIPLLSKGEKVRFLFDGYPAIVFSGWPNASYGLFSGNIVAIENSLSTNGKFRVLIAEDSVYKPWPQTLRNGAGASGIALLNDVPVWYELWRNINGFPPDYYEPKEKDNAQKKK